MTERGEDRIGTTVIASIMAGVIVLAVMLENQWNFTDRWRMSDGCRDAVREELVAPRTAKFPSRLGLLGEVSVDKDAAVLRSFVDAQNSFGTMVRWEYLCIGEWRAANWEFRVDIQGRSSTREASEWRRVGFASTDAGKISFAHVA